MIGTDFAMLSLCGAHALTTNTDRTMASKNSKEHESETETAEALRDSSTELTEEKEEEHVVS